MEFERTESKRNKRPPGHSWSDFAISDHQPDGQGEHWQIKDCLSNAQRKMWIDHSRGAKFVIAKPMVVGVCS